MAPKHLIFIAIAVSVLYGLGFALFDTTRLYAIGGVAVVALVWIAAGIYGRDQTGGPS